MLRCLGTSPTPATYRIDDVYFGTEIRGDTVLSVAASVEITLTPDDNAILDPGNSYEKRRVTVKATYGSSGGVNDEYDYQVKNLAKVS
jgi:hypothetical protein